MSELTNKLYKKEIEKIEKQIRVVKRLDIVNSSLIKYNWIFLHPYSQVMDIGTLQRLITGKDDPKKEILAFFAKKFLDLRTTIHFIHGFYSTRPFLKDYISSIEESVILCLQKDFKGAITVLLPVIEGTLRKNLIRGKGESKKTEVKISQLVKAFDNIGRDYVCLEKKYLKKRFEHLIASQEYFDINQEKRILKKHEEYFELWAKQMKDYLVNNLYFNTRESEVEDSFNRHIIFHAFDEEVNYTFDNYLRLFNCLNFLSWAIGFANEECSILSDLDEEIVNSKWLDYFNILIMSEALTETKNRIYHESVVSFADYLHPKYKKILKQPVLMVREVLKMNDFLRET